jgi:hypothetical protein
MGAGWDSSVSVFFLVFGGVFLPHSRSGKILKDAETMAEAGMKDGDFIVVMVSKVCGTAWCVVCAPPCDIVPGFLVCIPD